MAIFKSKLLNYQRVNLHFPLVFKGFCILPMVFLGFSGGFPMVFLGYLFLFAACTVTPRHAKWPVASSDVLPAQQLLRRSLCASPGVPNMWFYMYNVGPHIDS